jgi:hypothetical protein
MDLWAWVTSAVGLAAIGIILILLGYRVFDLGWTAKGLKRSKMIGVLLIAAAIAVNYGVFSLNAQQAPPATSVGSFDVTVADSMGWVTENNNDHTITWAVTYNYTAGDFSGVGTAAGGAGAQSNSQYCQVVFTVQRGLGTVGLVQTYGDVKSVPSVVNQTTGTSYDLLTKTSSQFNALWTRADASTAYNMVTLTIAETADGAVVTLNMTLAASAVGSMIQYAVQPILIDIGGQTWTCEVLLSTVS